MSRAPLRASLIAAASILALASSACGVTAPDGTDALAGPPEVVTSGQVRFLQQAAQDTGQATTYKVATEISMTHDGSTQITASGTGELDTAAGRGRYVTDVGSALDELDGLGDLLPADAGELEVVVDGDVVYLRSSLLASFAGTDAPWVEIPTAGLLEDAPAGLDLSGTIDPGALLELFEGASGELRELGTEEVRGVDTRHVGTTIDLAGLLSQLPEDRRAELEDRLASLGYGLDDFPSFPAEAWIDADGLIRRFTLTFDGSTVPDDLQSGLDGLTLSVTCELYDVGVPVDIAVPDPSEVSELDLSFLGEGGN